MEEKRVSVVVPVYNVREYLEESVESICNQTHTNLEIILIDDGSTDGSSEICDRYAQKDRRIQVVHQENTGLAGARTKGILSATAEYLCFVDSDDTVDRGMVRHFMQNMGDADLLTSGCLREEENGSYTRRYDSFEAGLYRSETEMEYMIRNVILYRGSQEDGLLPYRWGKLYRTGLLKEVVQSADKKISCYEDRELLYRYILHCRCIRITKESFYHYR